MMTEKEAEEIGFAIADSADGGYCSHCTRGVVDALAILFPGQLTALRRGANKRFSYDEGPPRDIWVED